MPNFTIREPLPVLAELGAVLIGDAVALLEDASGSKVFINGQLAYVWGPGQEGLRRLAAAQLVEAGAGTTAEVAAGFGVNPESVRRWRINLADGGLAGVEPVKKGPKGPSRLTAEKAAEIRAHRGQGASLRAVAAATGVSTDTVRRALAAGAGDAGPAAARDAETAAAGRGAGTPASVQPELPLQPEPAGQDEDQDERAEPVVMAATCAPAVTSAPADPALPAVPAIAPVPVVSAVLPVLPAPVPRTGERSAARAGLLACAAPVFAPAARVPHAGLFLAFPALEVSGLLSCAQEVFGALPDGFYGMNTILVDAVLRALAGESRAEGATRFNPEDLGRVLGLDRAPEVKTVRRRNREFADTGKAGEFIAALAAHHLAGTGPNGEDLAGILYVDGHVRAYQGTKKIGKIYSTRLKFAVPATEETWVTDAHGSPVFVVMAKPGASLAGELRDLLPDLRTAVGDDRRVLVGFDRGGWSPALFKHMDESGFDSLTWRKGTTPDIDAKHFHKVTHTDDHGEEHSWMVADTLVELDLPTTKKTGETYQIRQLSRIVAAKGKDGGTRQIHVLTTDKALDAGEAVYLMGNRWRQENQFRYARMHFDLDSHDSYASSDDDKDRLVPNPAKKKSYQKVLAARKHHAEVAEQVEAALTAVRTPLPGAKELKVVVSNRMHNKITKPLWKAEKALAAAEAAHKKIPAKIRLGKLAPGQQVLDTETKLIHTGIRMAAHNTAMTIAREIRTNTGYKRSDDEAHALMRQAFNSTGDIDPTEPGYLTIRLDPLPTHAKTRAIAELCEHLTATQTRYPGTELILRYEVKNRA